MNWIQTIITTYEWIKECFLKNKRVVIYIHLFYGNFDDNLIFLFSY